jgi:alpha-beta hydrolase superfamily lysophospholipase
MFTLTARGLAAYAVQWRGLGRAGEVLTPTEEFGGDNGAARRMGACD